MGDILNTRKCFITTDIKEAKAFKEDGTTSIITQVELKEIPFMDLKVNDIFVLYEDTGGMVVAKCEELDTDYMASKAICNPYIDKENGVFGIQCDPYIFPTSEVKFVRR